MPTDLPQEYEPIQGIRHAQTTSTRLPARDDDLRGLGVVGAIEGVVHDADAPGDHPRRLNHAAREVAGVSDQHRRLGHLFSFSFSVCSFIFSSVPVFRFRFCLRSASFGLVWRWLIPFPSVPFRSVPLRFVSSPFAFGLFRFVSSRFISLRFESVRFVSTHFALECFVSFCFVLHWLVSFRVGSFRFVSFRFVSFRSGSFRF